MWYKHNKEGIEHDKGMIRRLSNEDSNEIAHKLNTQQHSQIVDDGVYGV